MGARSTQSRRGEAYRRELICLQEAFLKILQARKTGLALVEKLAGSPFASVLHGRPRLFDFKSFAFLQKLKGDVVR